LDGADCHEDFLTLAVLIPDYRGAGDASIPS
jgi:hypothetical protein